MMPVSCFDGGVEMFIGDKPKYREAGAGDGGEVQLCQWLDADQGVLVTHEPQFRGYEADAVIFVTRDWNDHEGITRSPLTRAVAHLCLITGDHYGIAINFQKMKRHWEVEIIEEDVRE